MLSIELLTNQRPQKVTSQRRKRLFTFHCHQLLTVSGRRPSVLPINCSCTRDRKLLKMFPHVFKMSSRVACRQFVRTVTYSDKHAVVKGLSDGPNAGKPLTTGEVLIGVSAFGLVLAGPLIWTVSSIAHKRWGGNARGDGDDNE
uniref:Uncharacterized protein n=1 Tax=Branchiostoma floridae TaxID=7739 RepID=C3XS57_BRAFL|eukprot:XP_002613516.1 hypothetical protein BRAFLDRAFT_119828 [Branchiostoma floridae]